jgi:hypothetical protein
MTAIPSNGQTLILYDHTPKVQNVVDLNKLSRTHGNEVYFHNFSFMTTGAH